MDDTAIETPVDLTAEEDKPDYEALFGAVLTKLSIVRSLAKKYARSGNPGRRAAGHEILEELE